MKFIIHLIDGNRLILSPKNDSLSPAQVERITETLSRWNNGDTRNLVLPLDAEIIDLRTPQKEQIEAVVRELIQEHDKQSARMLIDGIKLGLGGTL